MDWIESGCTGVCHIAPVSRKALKELAKAKTIECNDIETALEAWDWAFESNEAELARFEIDDTPHTIQAYYESLVRWHGVRVAVDMERRQ
ncbi:Zn-dependent oligopeptidase [Bradyrhizobium sp. LM3.6]